jgi:hypothetical protein
MSPDHKMTADIQDILGYLESQVLGEFYSQVIKFPYIKEIRIEIVHEGEKGLNKDGAPAQISNITTQCPIIEFVDSLERNHQIEAIAHELMHLFLIHRFGLRVIERNNKNIILFLDNKDWSFLAQITNVTHHQILIGLLKEQYGIGSNLHLSSLRNNYPERENSSPTDREALYKKGLVAFEYEKLIGGIGIVMNLAQQAEPFQKAYHSALKHFGKYSFRAIPDRSSYETNIYSFIEDLGYQRKDFMFRP